MIQYCIVGFGIAGQLLVLELLKTVPAKDILVIDSAFLGGALSTDYYTVQSNTPWKKTKTALLQYLPHSQESIQEGDAKYQENECMPVGHIAKYCLETAQNAASACEKLTAAVKAVYATSDFFEVLHSFGRVNAKTVFVCTGGVEKGLKLDIPKLPLSIALDKNALSRFVDSTRDTVAVFGTSHSGTIVLQNLHSLGIPTVGIYGNQSPFLFARDGHYDGIKEGSEKIADSILLGEYTNLTLLRLNDICSVHMSLKKATKVVYAIGFEANLPGSIDKEYSYTSAEIGTVPGLYGFGLAYPGKTVIDGKEFVDVSVLSFQEQIQRTLPAILEKSKCYKFSRTDTTNTASNIGKE